MPRRPRHTLTGVAFHVMNRAVRGTTLIENDRDFDALARILREALYESRVEVISYQVMQTHWHFVMTCARIADLSTLMHRFEGRHANNWAGAHRARGRGYVYQGRFKSVPVQTSHSLFRVCRYVERNALRQNLVAKAETGSGVAFMHVATITTPSHSHSGQFRHRQTGSSWSTLLKPMVNSRTFEAASSAISR